MQHILGTVLRGNDAELFDEDPAGKESYSFMDLLSAMAEGERRMMSNPDIMRINVYEVFDGVQRSTLDGRNFQLAHCLLREGTPMPNSN